MNSKKSARRKRARTVLKTKTKDGTAEVFVLPPELLQKLGINLGKIGSSQECPTIVSSESDTSLNIAPATSIDSSLPNPKLTQKETAQDTTILETANLMKKSVFLSPTFAVNGINSSPSELDISNVLEHGRVEVNGSTDNVDESNFINIFPKNDMDNAPYLKLDGLPVNSEVGNNTFTNNAYHHQINLPDSNPVPVPNQETLQLTVSTDDVTNIVEKQSRLICTDDHPDDHLDEAYSSDCSNSNLGPSENTLNYIPDIHSVNVEMPLQSSNNISIISEEILSSSQIKELKRLHSPTLSNLIPISINTIITSKKIGECADILKGDLLIDLNKCENRPCKPYPEACKSMETVILFDEKGNVIDTDSNNMSDANETDILIENMSEALSQESFNKIIDPQDYKIQTHENSIGVSIDFVVTNIDMHLKENEDILEKFVNEITSNDNEILAKIEKSEEECFNKINTNDTHLVTNDGKPVAFNYDESGLKQLLIHCQNETDKVYNDWCTDKSHKNSSLSSIHDEKINRNKENEFAEFIEINVESDTQTSSVIEDICENNTKEITESICKDIEENKSVQRMEVESESFKTTGNIEYRHVTKQNDPVQIGSIVHMNKTTDCVLQKLDKENQADFVVSEKNTTNEITDSIYNDIEETKSMQCMEVASEPIKNTGNIEDREFTKQNNLVQIGSTIDVNMIVDMNKTTGCVLQKSDEANQTDIAVSEKNNTNEITESMKCMEVELEPIKNTGNIENREGTKKNNPVQIGSTIDVNKTTDCVLKKPVEANQTDIAVDRVKEIAMYLAQAAKHHSAVRKLKNKSNKCLKIPNKQAKQNLIKPKLFKQGVEKPGGPTDIAEKNGIPKVSKTYINHKKSTKISVATVATHLPHIPPASSSAKEAQNTQLVHEADESESVIEENDIRTPEFCLCEDFGIFAYYDTDCIYEHIHFWEHKNIVCNREMIFSIYNDIDDFETRQSNALCLEQEIEANLSEDVYSICWHTFENSNKDKESQNKEKSSMFGQEKVIITPDTSSKEPETHSFNRKPNDIECNVETNKESLESVPDAVMIIQGKSNSFESENGNTRAPAAKKAKVEQVSSERNNTGSSKQITSDEKCITSVSKEKEEELIIVNDDGNEKGAGTNILSDQSQSESRDTNVSDQIPDASKSNEIKAMSSITASDIDNEKSTDSHITTNKSNTEFSNLNPSIEDDDEPLCKLREEKLKQSVQCDVCQAVVSEKEWEDHISNEHCYIAWTSGSSITLDDPDLKTKLQAKLKDKNVLKCPFCGLERKFIKKFLSHVKTCIEAKNQSTIVIGISDDTVVKCAVCHEELKNSEWMDHNAEKHRYKAWKDGESPLKRRRAVYKEVEEEDEVEPPNKKSVRCDVCQAVVSEKKWEKHVSNEHCYIAWRSGSSIDLDDPHLKTKLQTKLEDTDVLICPFCGIERKYAKKFLSHVKQCMEIKNLTNFSLNHSSKDLTIEVAESTKVAEIDDPAVKCAVCELELKESEWIDHIAATHNYVAWKDGENPLVVNNEEELRQHLTEISRKYGELKCHKCGLCRKYAKLYMQHVQQCGKNESRSGEASQSKDLDVEINQIQVKPSETKKKKARTSEIKCGVCEKVIKHDWIGHIEKEHAYLAWKSGDPPLAVDNEEEVKQHLYNILQKHGKLVCNKCGLTRKYVKPYQNHVQKCLSITTECEENCNLVKCGVCHMEVPSRNWIQHIQNYHAYMAWVEGETLDLTDQIQVELHLDGILKKVGGLQCPKCGLVRKYASHFLQHWRNCEMNHMIKHEGQEKRTDQNELVCAVCSEYVELEEWKNHKMGKHYNVAWAVGNPAVNYKDPNVIDSLMKEYMEWSKKLVCRTCGASRVSRVGFYAHIIACGKTEEEIERHRTVCTVCDKKYFYIYESQHMTWHREQEKARIRRQRALEESEAEEKVKCEEEAEEPTLGPRRAAQKARKVIEKYKVEISESDFTCSICGFGADTKDELDNHVCVKVEKYDSDTDESVKLEDVAQDESEDSAVDSDISDDEELNTVKKRNRKSFPACANVPRFPIELPNVNSYLVKSGVELSEFHFTTEDLFPEWQNIVSELVPEEKLSDYMPSLEESCQVNLSSSWTTFKRFEARLIRGAKQCLFVGGSIQCVSWAPPRDRQRVGDQYLAVIVHQGPDIPRIHHEDVAAGPGLIQIWDFGRFHEPAKFVLGLAHDYGTAWGIDWCPSGAQNILDQSDEENSPQRLGLLAVACSNGSSYIFSVPFPSSIVKDDKPMYKFKPVVELRLTMSNDRKKYQATSITWSKQKNHDTILVGYADGSTAYFDLKTESSILKTKENDVTILYPYHDVRPHNTCVLGVDMYPCSSGDSASVVCSASTTGAALVSRPAVRPARQQTHMPCVGACFEPHWPTAVLVVDDASTASMVNELEWWGGGRRLGGPRTAAACLACARLVMYTPPLLRALCPHPAHKDFDKKTFAILQMAPLGKKRKLKNDELQMKVEPLSYEDAVKKYGVELITETKSINRASRVRDTYPDRFPLADVTSMAFCPSAAHHDKLAVATHAGIVLLLTV